MKKKLRPFILLLFVIQFGCRTDEPQESPVYTSLCLPTIFIDTDDGEFIQDRVTWRTMTFSLVDINNPENNIGPITNQQIRGRGNSTFAYGRESNPYRIRFRTNQIQGLFGHHPARNWVLLRGHRNGGDPVGFELGRRLGLECTPSFQFVRVVFNGHDQGLYMLTEHRQAAPNYITERGVPGRPKLAEQGGWFVHIDRNFDEDPRFRTRNFNLPVMIQTPTDGLSDGLIPESINNFVRNDWNHLTDLMVAPCFPENEWRDLIYMDSWVRYFIVQTVIRHRYLSNYHWGGHIADLYAYKDVNGRIAAGPLWDLDNSLIPVEYTDGPGNPHPEPIHTARREPWMPWVATGAPFYNRFFADPTFVARYKEIWNENFKEHISTMPLFFAELSRTLGIDFGPRRFFLDERIPFLDSVYNTVSAVPKHAIFSANTSNTTPQIFTFVAYGRMSNLNAVLQNGNESTFEIITGISTRSSETGNGYFATLSVGPRHTSTASKHTDMLIFSGTHQGNEFTVSVPITLEY